MTRPAEPHCGYCTEQALRQLRCLPPAQAASLLVPFLRRSGLQSPRLCWSRGTTLTLHAHVGSKLARVAVLIRVHLRRSRLQELHVDAFRSQLARSGAGLGIVVNGGAFAPGALRTVFASGPQLRFIAGPEWLPQLLGRSGHLKRPRTRTGAVSNDAAGKKGGAW